MTLHRQANHYSHYYFYPALGREAATCTRRLSGYSVSTTRHNAIGIVSHVGPHMGHVWRAVSADHRALLSRDETPRHDVQGAARRCEAESIVFHGGVASWRGIHDVVVHQRPVPAGGTMGPAMDPKIIALWIEKSYSAISRDSQCHAGPNNSSSSAPAADALPPSAGYRARAARPVTRSAPWSRTSWCGSDRSPHCAGALRVRSTVLWRRGVASWEPNQARDGRRCLGERFEQSFEETFGPNDCRNSGASSASCGATRSRTSSWRSASAARNAQRNSTSRASASLPMKRSWSCSTSCVRASGPEIPAAGYAALERGPRNPRTLVTGSGAGLIRSRSESNQRQTQSTAGTVAARVASRPVTGRSVTATSETMDATGGESAAPQFSSGDALGIHQPRSMTRGFGAPTPRSAVSPFATDEPMFVLLARDPMAPMLVENWANARKQLIANGEKPLEDLALVEEAMLCAAEMRAWRFNNDGKWRSLTGDPRDNPVRSLAPIADQPRPTVPQYSPKGES